jgi:hypothetical protein
MLHAGAREKRCRAPAVGRGRNMVSSDPQMAEPAVELSGKLLYIEDQPMNVALV